MDAETKIRINKIPPYDGEYELDTNEAFTAREWRWIKQISGNRPGTLEVAIDEGDTEFVVALAVIALNRAGKVARENVMDAAEKLLDVPFDGAHIQVVTSGADVGPPEPTTSPGDTSLSEQSLSAVSSGPDSRNDSVRSAGAPSPIGTTR